MRRYRIFVCGYQLKPGDIHQYNKESRAYARNEMQICRDNPTYLMEMIPAEVVMMATPFSSFNEAMGYLELSSFLNQRACVGIMRKLKYGKGHKVVYVRERGLDLHMLEMIKKMKNGSASGRRYDWFSILDIPSPPQRTMRLQMSALEYGKDVSVRKFLCGWVNNLNVKSAKSLPLFGEWTQGMFWDNMFARARFERDVADKTGIPLEELLKLPVSITADEDPNMIPITGEKIEYTIQFSKVSNLEEKKDGLI